jgi:glutamyl-tRNA reductase
MTVWALGINHTTAPLDLRGRFAFAVEQLNPTLRALQASWTDRNAPQAEAAILSTCNRTEIYGAGQQPHIEHTISWLAQSGGVAPDVLRSHTYTLQDGLADAMRFASPAGWTLWCWASRRSSAR